MSATSNVQGRASPDHRPRHRAGFFFSGVILMLSGIFAVLAPIVSTLAVTMIVGASLVVAGIAQIVQAFGARGWRGLFLNLLLGLICLAVGLNFFFRPVTGALAITLTLSWLLFVTGVGEIALGLRIRPQRGWPWFILSGLIAVAGGVWLLLRIPVNGFYVPGLILGIALLFEGAAFIAIAFGRDERVVRAVRDDQPT